MSAVALPTPERKFTNITKVTIEPDEDAKSSESGEFFKR